MPMGDFKNHSKVTTCYFISFKAVTDRFIQQLCRWEGNQMIDLTMVGVGGGKRRLSRQYIMSL